MCDLSTFEPAIELFGLMHFHVRANMQQNSMQLPTCFRLSPDPLTQHRLRDR